MLNSVGAWVERATLRMESTPPLRIAPCGIARPKSAPFRSQAASFVDRSLAINKGTFTK